MKRKDEERAAASLARGMAMICVRNTVLEDLHAGYVLMTKTGDFSDVVVIDGTGRRIPWTELSRLDDGEMRDLMRQVVDRLYTFLLRIEDPAFRDAIDPWMNAAARWDDPVLDPGLAKTGSWTE
ncbi:hypothetical protein [Paracoccus versutus]|uniref:Uncharacterized protein n=1 Tax=Paracoccus versutus TaxID=34007 RepID=A0A3D9XUZ7_PARVE|nr:hypothetical protein [Paracoccus versutus]REF73468.1 hypothetical protein BDD41_2028 [Paracoccus versutus]WGR54748.1 hypothetical protein E3U25_01255 [Paracoccus versutus]